jgi:hypothetical protein
MKLLLRLSLLIFTLFTGLYAVSMFGMDTMASPQMDMSMTANSMPGGCTSLCVANAHNTGTIALPQQIKYLLGLFAVMAVLLLILPFVRLISSAALGYIARPPDIILLYGHFRI